MLPGLFDCHVHLAFRYEDFDEYARMQEPFSLAFFRMAQNLRTTLALGITTVRDAAGADAGLRAAVDEGALVGPRMQISVHDAVDDRRAHRPVAAERRAGSSGSSIPGMPSGVCDGVDGVSAKVREVIRAGADVIKIASSGGFLSPADDPMQPNFSQDEVDAIVRTAADLGTWVMSHAHGAEGIKRAVRAGVRSIEHGTFLDEEAVEMMVERGTWLVPTLTAGDTTEALANDEKVPAGGAGEAPGARPAGARGVPAGGRGRREGRDGYRLPGGAARHEPERAAPHGRERVHPRAGAARRDAQRGRADGPAGRARARIEPGKRADLVVRRRRPARFDDYEARIEQVWKDGVRVVPFASG